MSLPIARALELTQELAPVATWSNEYVRVWDYTPFDARYHVVRTTSAWDAARNKGAGRTFSDGQTRVALPVELDPNESEA